MPTTLPLRSEVWMLMMPMPPRVCRRYSLEPGALAVAVLGDGQQRAARRGRPPSRRPRRPRAARCRGRRRPCGPSAGRRSSAKRIAMPLRVPMTDRSVPSESRTAITASPSSIPIAMMPPARGLRERRQVGLLDRALARAHHDEPLALVLGELLHARAARRSSRRPAIVHQVRDRLALAARGPTSGIVVDLQPVARGRGP